MTSQRTQGDDFDRLMTAWFVEDGQVPEPDELLERVLDRTRQSRRRPAWLLPERWISVQMTMRFRPIPRLAPVLILIAVLLIAALAVVMVGSRPRLPSPFGPAANGRVAYVSAGHLFTTSATGVGAVQITFGDRADAAPVWSRDGTRIAFKRLGTASTSADAGLFGDLVVVNADGSGLVVIDADTNSMSPTRWSPDGRTLLYSRLVGDRDAIFVADADGSSPPVEVGDPATGNWGPAFSPDGQSIAYIEDADKDSHAVYVMAIDGSNARKLTITPFEGIEEPAFDPSGTRLVFSAQAPKTDDRDVWLVGLDGDPEHAITTDHHGYSGASWSPDGSRLVYLMAGNGNGPLIVVAGADGSHPRTLPGTFAWLQPFWSPDGTRIVAIDLAPITAVFLLDPDGSAAPIVVDIARPATDVVAVSADVPTWQRLAP
jgi:Tol biopolymer transport system component